MLSRWVFAVLLSIASMAAMSADWELARDRKGIKVWTKEEPGYPIRAFKAVTVVESSLTGLVTLIMDTDRVDQWAYRVMRIEVLSRDDDAGTFVIRTETDFPWPLTNRDVVLVGKVSQDDKSRVVTIRSRSTPPGQYPLHPDFLRMPDMVGDWILRPLPGGRVEVTMIGRANPSGNVPFGVVNLIIHETPYLTLLGLRDLISNERYRNAPRLKQIRELDE
jgi:hypothetical protein